MPPRTRASPPHAPSCTPRVHCSCRLQRAVTADVVDTQAQNLTETTLSRGRCSVRAAGGGPYLELCTAPGCVNSSPYSAPSTLRMQGLPPSLMQDPDLRAPTAALDADIRCTFAARLPPEASQELDHISQYSFDVSLAELAVRGPATAGHLGRLGSVGVVALTPTAPAWY